MLFVTHKQISLFQRKYYVIWQTRYSLQHTIFIKLRSYVPLYARVYSIILKYILKLQLRGFTCNLLLGIDFKVVMEKAISEDENILFGNLITLYEMLIAL